MKLTRRLSTKILFILIGSLSAIWFLIRVIPKPSRATYPCQRAAFPIASTFVIWLTGSLFTYLSFKKARRVYASKKLVALGLFSLSAILFAITYVIVPSENNMAIAKSIFHEKPVLEASYNITEDQYIDPQATVAIVKADKENAEDVTDEELESMIRQAVEMSGGLEDIVTDGDVVVLKPNMVSTSAPNGDLPLTANGMITDYRVVAIVAEIVRELNPTGSILVMEGSAANTISGFVAMNYNKTSIPDADEILAIDECSGDWMEYDAPELVEVNLPAGKKLYPNSLKPNNSDEFYYNRRYFEADVLISLPVLKNHETAGITGAVKNLSIGATPTNIYGNSDDSNGRWNIISHDAAQMHRWLHDFYYLRPADFAIMDGLQGWNNGPVFNHGSNNLDGHQENMRVILASKDAIAMDAIEGLLMGDDPRDVDCLVYLDNSGLGCADPLAIRVVGTEVSDIKKSFPHDLNKTVCTYTDFTPPNVYVESISLLDDNFMNISFSSPEEISSVEVKIDDDYYPKIIISDFSNIELDFSGVTYNANSIFTVFANDEYLNTTQFTYNGVASISDLKPSVFHNEVLSVYPNPASEILTIEMTNSYIGDISYEVYSMNGKVVMSGTTHKNQSEFKGKVTLSTLEAGNYIFRMKAGTNSYNKQIVKL
jgi:uncharacterized protein (DUF362 family)